MQGPPGAWRRGAAPMALGAISMAQLPPPHAYVWIVGRVRSHQGAAAGTPSWVSAASTAARVTFVGYWRRGLTEEQLRAAESQGCPTGRDSPGAARDRCGRRGAAAGCVFTLYRFQVT